MGIRESKFLSINRLMPLMQVLTISWSLKQYGLLYSKVPRKLASAFMGTLGLSDVLPALTR